MREDGAAAQPRRLRDAGRLRILHLACATYAGCNDHHLCEKLVEREGFSLSRGSLRRLLRKDGQGSPLQRRAPAHRQRHLRSALLGGLVQLHGSPYDWLEGRSPQLTTLGMKDDTTGKILATQFFPSEPPSAISACFARLKWNDGRPQVVADQSKVRIFSVAV